MKPLLNALNNLLLCCNGAIFILVCFFTCRPMKSYFGPGSGNSFDRFMESLDWSAITWIMLASILVSTGIFHFLKAFWERVLD